MLCSAGLYRKHSKSMTATSGAALRADRMEMIRSMYPALADAALREAAIVRARNVARMAYVGRDPGGRAALWRLFREVRDLELGLLHLLWSLRVPPRWVQWVKQRSFGMKG